MTKITPAEDFAFLTPDQLVADLAQAARDAGLDPAELAQAGTYARIAGILRARPEIGELCREGHRVFYVMIAGEAVEAEDPADLPNAEEIARRETIARLRRSLQDSIDAAEALLEELREQAVQTRCVLILGDSSMGVGRDADGVVLRLRPMRGDLAGLVKWPAAEARRHARLWNAGVEAKANPRLQVEAVPLRQALRRLIDGQRQLLGQLD